MGTRYPSILPSRVMTLSVGDRHPDHETIAEFRRRHLNALAALFTQALLLCQRAGLVKLGRVAIDGAGIEAGASRHKARSYMRMGTARRG